MPRAAQQIRFCVGRSDAQRAHGGIAFDHALGTDAWSYRAANPDAARDFDDSMVSYVAASNAAVIATGAFSKAGRIVDVGGGEGALLLAILAAHPNVAGTVFERPHVARKAERRVAASDLQMMVMNGGRERTEREYRGLLESAGFRFVRRIPTGTVTEVLEGEAW